MEVRSASCRLWWCGSHHTWCGLRSLGQLASLAAPGSGSGRKGLGCPHAWQLFQRTFPGLIEDTVSETGLTPPGFVASIIRER